MLLIPNITAIKHFFTCQQGKISNHLVIGCCYWRHCMHAYSVYKITAKLNKDRMH